MPKRKGQKDKQQYTKRYTERLSTILIFCDISKAFERVWHEGLIKKLKSYGIWGDLLIWLKQLFKW